MSKKKPKAAAPAGKKTFSFVTCAGITLTTDVEAETLEEAIEIAESRAIQSLCNQCASPDYKEEWGTTGELDGSPGKLVELVIGDDHMSASSTEFALARETFDE